MADHIIMHEDIQRSSFLRFTAGMAARYGTLPVPNPAEAKGSRPAIINHGRWLCVCPTCGSAAYVSDKQPLFWCAECGSPENGGQWYRVIFPRARADIEAVLLKRPYILGRGAPNRNWTPGETIAKLEAENAARGIA